MILCNCFEDGKCKRAKGHIDCMECCIRCGRLRDGSCGYICSTALYYVMVKKKKQGKEG